MHLSEVKQQLALEVEDSEFGNSNLQETLEAIVEEVDLRDYLTSEELHLLNPPEISLTSELKEQLREFDRIILSANQLPGRLLEQNDAIRAQIEKLVQCEETAYKQHRETLLRSLLEPIQNLQEEMNRALNMIGSPVSYTHLTLPTTSRV